MDWSELTLGELFVGATKALSKKEKVVCLVSQLRRISDV
jgi:hypothetical protein